MNPNPSRSPNPNHYPNPNPNRNPHPNLSLTSTLTLTRCAGDWVEFVLVDGTLRATDYAGQTFVWGTRVAEGEVWVPTVAWTGSRASILLAPPAL